MSPNEAQLRAALRDGEGDPVDVNRVIGDAIQTRAQRRQRMNAALAGAGVVAVIGVGIGALVALSGGNSGSGSSSAGGSVGYSARGSSAQHATGAAAGGGANVPASTQASAETPAMRYLDTHRCPAHPAHLALPGGGGSGQFGANGSLFDQPVAALTMCVYTPALRGASIVGQPTAAAIAKELDAAPYGKSTANRCTGVSPLVGRTVQIVAVTQSGTDVTELKPVVVEIRCGLSIVTDGTAVRYVRNLPPELLDAATGPIGSPAAGGRASGSPIHS